MPWVADPSAVPSTIATIADSAVIWPALIRLARDANAKAVLVIDKNGQPIAQSGETDHLEKPLPAGEDSYEKRSAWLLDRGLGVWDVYASCRREGSHGAGLETHPRVVPLGCERQNVIDHRPPHSEASRGLARVHRLQLGVRLVQPAERPDSEQDPSAARAAQARRDAHA